MATTGVNNYVSLYSSRAHVFQIDKETRSRWIEKGNQAIPISIVATIDQSSEPAEPRLKRDLKIIGTNEAGKTVLDVVISPKTFFNRRSQKFGQWTDPSGEVYGLGFSSEAELIEFNNTFQQLQRDILSSPTQSSTPGSNIGTSERVAPSGWPQQSTQQPQHHQQHQYDAGNTSETNGRIVQSTVNSRNSSSTTQYSNTIAHTGSQQQAQEMVRSSGLNSSYNSSNNSHLQTNGNNDSVQYPKSQSMFGLQTKSAQFTGRESNGGVLTAGVKSTPEPGASPLPQNDWHIRDQLKYENERLKQALEESSKNAQIWNKELLNLRTNNVKLTQALQESKAHVEEWERELVSLRDENKELKMRLSTLESPDGQEKGSDYKEDLHRYKSCVEEYQNELKRKESEIEDMQKAMEQLQLKTSETSQQQNGRQQGDIDPDDLVVKPLHKQKFDVINAKLEAKLNDLVNIQKEYSQVLDSLYR